jgi:hypothetical protein
MALQQLESIDIRQLYMGTGGFQHPAVYPNHHSHQPHQGAGILQVGAHLTASRG